MKELRPLAVVRIPAADGKLLAEVHRDGEVVEQHAEDGTVVMLARVDEMLAGRLRRGGAEVVAQ
jgi:GTP-binding protein HflX